MSRRLSPSRRIPRHAVVFDDMPALFALPPGTSYDYYLADGATKWCSGVVKSDGSLSQHPLLTAKDGAYFPLSELKMLITDLTLNAGGINYVAGDVGSILTLVGGASGRPATARIDSVAAGAVTGVTFLDSGEYTTGVDAGAATTGGTGTGCTLDPTWALPGDGYVQPLTNPSKVAIASTGIISTDASRARLPVTVKRPIGLFMHSNIALGATGAMQICEVVDTALATPGADDSYGIYVLYNAGAWKSCGVRRNGGAAGTGTYGAIAATAERRVGFVGVPSDTACTIIPYSHAWGFRGSYDVGSQYGVTIGLDYTSAALEFYVDIESAGTGDTTFVGVLPIESHGQGFS